MPKQKKINSISLTNSGILAGGVVGLCIDGFIFGLTGGAAVVAATGVVGGAVTVGGAHQAQRSK